ncbi:MAG: hypothetical protein A4C66_13115 [Nitrospira sp. HN-bin3]|nr:MAG: hypothetical protein A4C66_13115 [Nitrospira sp. HN-bin3]
MFKKFQGAAAVASGQTLRRSCATHPLEDGYEIRTVQELMRHIDHRTIMIDAHILHRRSAGCPQSAGRDVTPRTDGGYVDQHTNLCAK